MSRRAGLCVCVGALLCICMDLLTIGFVNCVFKQLISCWWHWVVQLMHLFAQEAVSVQCRQAASSPMRVALHCRGAIICVQPTRLALIVGPHKFCCMHASYCSEPKCSACGCGLAFVACPTVHVATFGSSLFLTLSVWGILARISWCLCLRTFVSLCLCLW